MARSRFSGPIRSTGGYEVGTGSTNTEVIGSDGKVSANGVVTASITNGAVTNAKLADATKVVHNVRTRVTAAQVNTGVVVLPAVAGKKYRITDFTLIAIGGNAAGATSVDIKAGTTVIAATAVAALTQSAVVKPNSANVTVLADGASFVPMAANTAITVIKAGSNLTTATNVDVILSYTLED